jgi:endonuclease YncB( thermonuclease family)
LLLAKFAVLALAGLLAVWLVGSTLDGIWVGKPIVLDGDTLEFEAGEVRLYGIDAPSFDQKCATAGKPWACGAYSMAALLTASHGRTVWCFEKGVAAGDVVVAQCYAGISDLASDLVEQGWATVGEDSSGRYGTELAAAKNARRGIWNSTLSPHDPLSAVSSK